MKTLIILSLALVSLNAFSAIVGEDKKSECAFANQNKREPKSEIKASVAQEKKEAKTIAK